ncbi:MAG: T9SS type A sorting domain-containing protein, partial [Saprospiraceae bacterium]
TPPVSNSPCGTTITTGANSITIGGYSEPIAIIQIFDSSWQLAFSCMGDECTNPLTVDGLADGTYYVKVNLFDNSWQRACEEVAGYYTLDGTSNLESSNSEFLFFNAIKTGREVALDWTVNTAYKTDSYIAEHSADGLNFESIADVKNDRDTENTTNYQDKDKSPEMGRNFYRLKQIFKDGSFRYSQIRTIDFDFDVVDFSVFPNPATDMVYVNLSQYNGIPGTIQIVNNLGVILQEITMEGAPMDPVGIDVRNYAAGLYHINVKLEDKQQLTKRFVKERL